MKSKIKKLRKNLIFIRRSVQFHVIKDFELIEVFDTLKKNYIDKLLPYLSKYESMKDVHDRVVLIIDMLDKEKNNMKPKQLRKNIVLVIDFLINIYRGNEKLIQNGMERNKDLQRI